MPELVRKPAAFVGALCLVAGLIAVVTFLATLGGGGMSARGVIGFVLGAAVIVLVPRLIPAPSLLGGFSALVYCFLFMPILVVVVYAFNSGRNVASFAGFSTK